MTEPVQDLSLGPIPAPVGRNFRWTLVAFALCGGLIAALVVWQLWELTPQRWCALAENTAGDVNSNACLSALLRILDLKDHALIGLLVILGITVVSVVVVALKVNVKGSGPGGFEVDIGADETQVREPDTGASVTIPTPPSEEVK